MTLLVTMPNALFRIRTDSASANEDFIKCLSRLGRVDPQLDRAVAREAVACHNHDEGSATDSGGYAALLLLGGNTPGLSRWRMSLFLASTHVTADAADYFHLPRDRTLIVGSRIEL